MINRQILLAAARNAAGVLVYVILVGLVITHGNQLFGPIANPIFGITTFLLLFVLSALITGLLVLGQPLLLYFQGQKKEGISLLVATAGWLFLLTVLALLAVLIIR